MDDIEDLGLNEFNLPQAVRKEHVLPKVLRRKVGRVLEEPKGGNIPGLGCIFLKTWGCAHNTSDGEYMAGLLADYGYGLTQDPLVADVWVLNSCAVKGPSEDTFVNSVKKGRELGKQVVVAGCVPQGQRAHPWLEGLSVVGVQQIDRVVEVVEETLKGHTVRLLGNKRKDGRKQGGASLDLPKIRRNPLVEIIPINTGCLNHCTYCKTKHARGDLGSYPPEEIVRRAQQAFSEGVVEVWLTSEDLGAYGNDIGVTLPELLWQLVDVIPEHCMMRLGMTNPPYIMEHMEEMSKILQHPQVYSFLHIPVQSGSNSVLEEMKREYTREDFECLVDFLKERVPGVTIATDIICGFPTETASDFTDTLELVRKYKFPSLFINQFYPRPGTPAARMKRIPTQQVKDRSRELTNLFHSYLPYTDKMGEMYMVLVTELSHDGQYFVGHNKFYEQVLVPKDEALLGKMIEVKIYETGKHFMKASVLTSPTKVHGVAANGKCTRYRFQIWLWMCVLLTLFAYCFLSIN
jgi:threonylcarbamoyladenosine tRNA methylthiotransferase CDKAL1